MPKKQVPAEVKYRLTVVYGPRKLMCNNMTFELGAGDTCPVIERVVTEGPAVIAREVVAIICDAAELVRFRQFVEDDGAISLDRNML